MAPDFIERLKASA